jgi:hypothetical protein
MAEINNDGSTPPVGSTFHHEQPPPMLAHTSMDDVKIQHPFREEDQIYKGDFRLRNPEMERLFQMDYPLTEAQQKAAEIELRLPSVVAEAAFDTRMYLNLGFKEQPRDEDVVRRFTDRIAQVDPDVFHKFEKLAIAVSHLPGPDTGAPKTEFTKMVEDCADTLQGVADKNGGRIGTEEIPTVASEKDRQNRALLLASVLSDYEVAEELEDTLVPPKPELHRAEITGGQNPVEYYENSGLSVGKRVAWAFTRAYKIVSNLSTKYPEGDSAQELTKSITDYSKHLSRY